ncbi:metal-dependent transcriptional regulator [uncultured Tessaracoccus sp.]|uniref:metal-dependent transcriptional regulator n=1 Tax=uncultured Tessaracoccus sp. TaxID=905023 RepID=UPI0025D5C44E|nr:metal-dependent transcriptional regulator [uncultured Tessaracoccus sp.]
MSDLIDTTEMYLRTVYELLEEGVPPLRARIAERLHQSGPTVSQTVSRMERDGLLAVQRDRTIKLTDEGFALATAVMRKHRLAERLLTDVIGLEWEKVHDEACRWEHVISLDVERRLVSILGAPTESPYGNPIPALDELGLDHDPAGLRTTNRTLREAVEAGATRLRLLHMSEHLQAKEDVLDVLAAAGVRPGVEFDVDPATRTLRCGDTEVVLDDDDADLLFVAVP